MDKTFSKSKSDSGAEAQSNIPPTTKACETRDEVALWNDFRKGNLEAFNAIYYKYIRLLYNYGSKITPDGSLVEDCIQDLFIELWQKRQILSETTSIKFYLFKSLNRKIVRKSAQEKRLSMKGKLTENYHFEVAFSHEFHLVTMQIDEEQKENLDKALQTLTPRQKEAIFLKYYEKLSFEEVAVIMAINVKATYKLVTRALDMLRKNIQQISHILVLAVCGMLSLSADCCTGLFNIL
jgi:RNA polymerase sigma factor (sigma-70 family)